MTRRRRKKGQRPQPKTAAPQSVSNPSYRGFALPVALALGLVVLSQLAPRIHENAMLERSFIGAASALLAWAVLLLSSLKRSGELRSYRKVLRPQHYAQALVQATVFAYWGYYWRPVYDLVPLLAGQILFAYAFDILLSWSRRETYVLGFGPFPIIFSTNLFLWFRDDWFYLQFLMIGLGFLGKEFVRWERDGKRTHIFNPSAFSLGLFSLVLIATSSSDLTWGHEIATTLTLAPHIYLFLFLVGLVVMYLFSITLIAGFAAATLFLLSVVYFRVTGVPYFIDSDIPTAVFLGLHLLVTDPSTSPRTALGKSIFGTLYGVGVFVLYAVLGAFGAPTFYDKLLCVPLLNLSVKWIDGLARSLEALSESARFPRWRPEAVGNGVYMIAWTLFFVMMTAVGSTDGTYIGDRLPFWQQACAEGRRHACDRLVQLETSYCHDRSAWACNELGRHYREGRIVSPDPERAWGFFADACELRNTGACFNLLYPEASRGTHPRALDLRLLLREGGPNLLDMSERDLLARACAHGFDYACDGGE